MSLRVSHPGRQTPLLAMTATTLSEPRLARHFPYFCTFLRWTRGAGIKGMVRAFLRAACAIGIVIAIAWQIENWRGKKRWEEAQAKLAAAGVSLKFEDYVYPEVPHAARDLMAPLHLVESRGSDQMLIMGLIRSAHGGVLAQGLANVLSRDGWNQSALAHIQELTGSLDLVGDLHAGFQYECLGDPDKFLCKIDIRFGSTGSKSPANPGEKDLR